MTKGYSILLLLAALPVMTGCVADDESLLEQAPVELMTSVVQMATEGSTRSSIMPEVVTPLEANTEFTVEFDGATVEETTYRTVGGSGRTVCTGEQPYFGLATSEVTARGYCPSKPTSGTFSVQTDQSTDAGYKASYLLYGTATIN